MPAGSRSPGENLPKTPVSSSYTFLARRKLVNGRAAAGLRARAAKQAQNTPRKDAGGILQPASAEHEKPSEADPAWPSPPHRSSEDTLEDRESEQPVCGDGNDALCAPPIASELEPSPWHHWEDGRPDVSPPDSGKPESLYPASPVPAPAPLAGPFRTRALGTWHGGSAGWSELLSSVTV